MMKWWLGALVGLSLSLILLVAPAGAESTGKPALSNRGEDSFLCTAAIQLRYPERCPQAGPGNMVADLARQGFLYWRPLPLLAFDPYLGYLPVDYLQVREEGAWVFPSVDAALLGTDPSGNVGPGFVFYTYTDRIESGEKVVYYARGGYFSSDQAKEATLTSFQGLSFRHTPDRPFGWIVEGGSCSQTGPASGDYGGNCYMKYEVVQIYGVERIGDWDWFRIGKNEWLEQRTLSVVTPDPTVPEGVEGDRWIVVDLYEQTVTAYQSGQLVYATVASTGRTGWWTQPGTFQVWAKLERDDMSGGVPTEDNSSYYYLDDVPWVLYFDQARALHGTYWHDKFGTPTSRGCVNLSPADAHWFFNFAEEGLWIKVWDPSGATPTDPSLYTAGGA